jgi:hypothetical protein
MSYMRDLEINVQESLMDLLGPEARQDPSKQAQMNDFLLHLSQWIDARARQAVNPDD